MGTWAVDAFGNDDAADWAYGLKNAKDLSLVVATLDKAIAARSQDEQQNWIQVASSNVL